MSVIQNDYLHYGVNSLLKSARAPGGMLSVNWSLKFGRILDGMRECQLSFKIRPDSERDARVSTLFPKEPGFGMGCIYSQGLLSHGPIPRGASLLLPQDRPAYLRQARQAHSEDLSGLDSTTCILRSLSPLSRFLKQKSFWVWKHLLSIC